MNISEDVVDFILRKEAGIDESIIDTVWPCILDYLGCAIAGSYMMQNEIKELDTNLGGAGNIPIIGCRRRSNPLSATLINGMEAHVAELDDGYRYGMLHPGAPVLSALLTAASVGIIKDGRSFIKGIIMGYEIACRLAEAIQPGHKLKGYHATATCGTVSSAIAVGIAADYTRQQLLQTLSAAVTSASGVLEMIDAPSQLKPYNVGRAALNGYISAGVGKIGLSGPKDPLGGNRGFFKSMAEDVNQEALLAEESGCKFQQRYTKAYAACRHCHSAIEAALMLADTYGFEEHEVRSIDIHTYKLAIYGHDQRCVSSVSGAKMSTPFSVAAAIITGNAGLETFTEENVHNEVIQSLASKVHVLEDKQLTEISPGKRSAIVDINLKNGKTLRQTVDHPLGEPENPISEEELQKKFFSLGRYAGKSDEELRILADTTINIKNNLSEWINLL